MAKMQSCSSLLLQTCVVFLSLSPWNHLHPTADGCVVDFLPHPATDHLHPPSPFTHSTKPCMLQQLNTPCLTHSGTVCPSALPLLLLLSLTPPPLPGVPVPTHTLGQFSHHTTLLLLLLLPGTWHLHVSTCTAQAMLSVSVLLWQHLPALVCFQCPSHAPDHCCWSCQPWVCAQRSQQRWQPLQLVAVVDATGRGRRDKRGFAGFAGGLLQGFLPTRQTADCFVC